MRSIKLSLGAVTVFALSGAVITVGCTASGVDGDPYDPNAVVTARPAEPSPGNEGIGGAHSSTSSGAPASSSGASSGGASSSSSGLSSQADAGQDAGRPDATTDAKDDAGPDASAFMPGGPCTRLGLLHEESCGFCGIRQSVCDGVETSPEWSAFGPCSSEVTSADRCMPAAVSMVSCGKCGTKTLVCQNDCRPAESACLGEVISGCMPGEIGYTTAACVTAGTFREHTCNDTCGWGPPAPLPCLPQDGDIIASSVLGGVSEGLGELTSDRTGPTITPGECGTDSVLVNDDETVSYTYTVVRNPLDRKIKVEVYYATAPGAGTIDTIAAAYAGKTEPTDRLACLSEVNDDCSDPVCLGGFSGLLGMYAVTIEPRDYITVYTGGYSSSQVGPFKMMIRTVEIR